MLVFVDSMILVHAIDYIANGIDIPEAHRAKHLLDELESKGYKIGIAAPSIAEYLLGTPPERHQSVLNAFLQHFTIYPFDLGAAAVGSKLWHEKFTGRKLSNLAKEANTEKQVFKVDHQIVSIALYRKADKLYSNDGPMTTFWKDYIKIEPPPEVNEQLALV